MLTKRLIALGEILDWSEFMSKFDDLAKLIADAKQRMMKEGEEALQEYFEDFFARWPEVLGVGWNQYTPYFNDGDECVFGLGEICVKLDKDALGDDEDEEDDYDEYGLGTDYLGVYNFSNYVEDTTQPKVKRSEYNYTTRKYEDVMKHPMVTVWKTPRLEKLSKELGEMSRTFSANSELFKMAFGDHMVVKVTREGTETSEYYHE